MDDAASMIRDDPQEKERYLRAIVEADPRRADAWHSLGILVAETGRGELAAECLLRAATLEGSNAVFQFDLGVALSGLKQFERAIECYQRAVELDRSLADAHFNCGNALRALRRLDEAAAEYRACLTIVPDSTKAFYNLANTLRDLRRPGEAITCYREAIRTLPSFLKARTNLGNLYKDLHCLDEAIAVYQDALQVDPGYALGYHNLAVALAAQQKLEEAEANYRKALVIQPDLTEARSCLVGQLVEQRRLDEAIAVLQVADDGEEIRQAWLRLAETLRFHKRYEEAIACIKHVLEKVDLAEAHNHLGLVLSSQGRLPEAIASYRRALELRPDYAEAHSNLGVSWALSKQHAEAIREFDLALAIRPDFATAHMNHAIASLRDGDFQQGWQEYEWRWLCSNHRGRRLRSPLWLGQSMPGGTVLLQSEQGLGDTIQFIRYAPLLKHRCGRVILQCHKSLKRLLERCPGIDEIVGREKTVPKHDAQSLLLSLPRVFGTNLATIPAPIPYLFADENLIRQWRERFGSIAGFKVGIAWQGSSTYASDVFRSVALRCFAPLARVPGVQFVSLQKGKATVQIREMAGALSVVDLGEGLDTTSGPFMDTAAIMHHLDLVISSDTSLVHLAGAMGRPVWVALGYSADWRWLDQREDCPWYPTMRLFRQSRLSAWEELFERIANDLEAVVQGDRARLSPKCR